MPFLYINSRGQEWRKHSYSAGLDFAQSPLKYYLRRVLGWKPRDDKASFAFGHALEEAIQFYHDHNGTGGVEAFIRNWTVHKEQPLKYAKMEKDWNTSLKIGTDMMKLYILRQPSLPIPLGSNVSFQREFSKEVFQNDPVYGEICDCGKLDVISYVDPCHPLLPKIEWKPEYGKLRPVIVDIKTSSQDLGETQGIVSFDSQLRRYSWLSGIRTVAFLWFVKKGLNLQKGSSISLLEDAGELFKAGQEAVIALVEDDGIWIVYNDFLIEEMERAQGQKNGKTEQTNAAKDRRREWLEKFAVKVKPESISKQRLQFNSGFVTPESAQDAGIQAGNQIVAIVNAWNSKQYTNGFSIRYPHDDRSDPYFKAFVLNDQMFRDQNFTKSDSAELDDLFVDEEPTE